MADFPVTLDVEVEEEAKGFDSYGGDALSTGDKGYKPLVIKKTKRVLTHKKTEELKASLVNIRAGLDEMFTEIAEVGSFNLAEIKVVLEVTAEGGFALVGSAKAGVKGGVTLTFAPPKK